MKIGPMIQNPGRVLCYTFMVWLLSQVMDNAIGNVVNVNVVKAKDSATLAGGKTQSVSSQVLEVNVANKDKPGQVLQDQVVDNVNMDVVNEDNPGQVVQNQVGDNGNMNKLEQVLPSLEDVNAVNAKTKKKAVNENQVCKQPEKKDMMIDNDDEDQYQQYYPEVPCHDEQAYP
jgi:hypothetical protein